MEVTSVTMVLAISSLYATVHLFGKGLDIHVRTKHMVNQQFSFVLNAIVRNRDDVLEVVDDGSHYINGALPAELPVTIQDFMVRTRSLHRKRR